MGVDPDPGNEVAIAVPMHRKRFRYPHRASRPNYLQTPVSSKTLVLIENPVPGGKRFLKMKCAMRHVSRGLAEFTATTRIRMIGSRHVDAVESAELQRRWGYDALVDNGKCAPLHHIAGLPAIKPTVLITNPTRRRVYSRFQRNGKVTVIFRADEIRKAA